jgi:hypothetical protein
MKSLKLLLTIFILLINCQISLSQESNENLILYQSRSDANYELIRALTDGLFTEISKLPNGVGYVVIYGGADKIQNAFYKKAVARNIRFRGMPEDKMLIISATDLEKPRFEFWISKNGEKPSVKQDTEPLVLPKSDQAIKFVEAPIEVIKSDGKSSFIPAGCDSGCITILDLYLLSDFLNANPQLRAFSIIHAKNLKNARKVKDILANEAVEDTGISSDRLNFLYGGRNKINVNDFSEIVVYLASDDSQLPKSSKKHRPL